MGTFLSTFFYLDQWIRCWVSSSIFNSGGHFVQRSRTSWVIFNRKPYEEPLCDAVFELAQAVLKYMLIN